MTTRNEDPVSTDNNDIPNQQATACDPDCGCHAGGPAGRIRWIVGVIVLVAAGALVARAVIKDTGASPAPAPAGYAALPTPEQTPAPAVTATAPDTNAVKEIAALSDLNTVAGDTAGVFVFLPGKGETNAAALTAQIRGAVRTIEPQLRGGKVGIFTMQPGSRDYEQVASQMTVPCVLAMVKGRGMTPVSGDITEAKLIQGFVKASSAGGCGSASGGCGPSSAGCN